MGATCDSNTSSTVVDIFVQYEMLSRQTCYMFQSFSFSHLSILLLWLILDRKTKMGICWSDKIFFLRKNEIFWNLMILRVNFVLMYNSQFLSDFDSYNITILGFVQTFRICAKFKFFVIFGWNLTEFQKTNFFVKLVTSFGHISVKNGKNHQSWKNPESTRKTWNFEGITTKIELIKKKLW
jgi:hypothetical protein